MLGEVVIEDVPSSCHRDVGFEIFFGKLATDCEDATSGHQIPPRAARHRA